MGGSDILYEYVPQSDGDHLADSKKVPGAKSGAQLNSENKVNGAGTFRAVSPDALREEGRKAGYRQRTEEERIEVFSQIIEDLCRSVVFPFVKETAIPWAVKRVKEGMSLFKDGMTAFIDRKGQTKASALLSSETQSSTKAPETVEMTQEEYDRLAAAAVSNALSLAGAARKLSAAKIIDNPTASPHRLDATALAGRAADIVEEHPELLESCDQTLLETTVFNCLNAQEPQAQRDRDSCRECGGA